MLMQRWVASIKQLLQMTAANPVTPWLVLAMSLVMTLMAYHITVAEIDSKIDQRFSLQSQDVAQAIQRRLAAYQLAIRVIYFANCN